MASATKKMRVSDEDDLTKLVESATKKMKVSEHNGSDPTKCKFAAEINMKDQEIILQQIEHVFQNKVTDRKLSWTKEVLMKNYPDFTAENIQGALIFIFSKKKEYAGRNLRQLISTLSNPDMIQSQELSYYISVGREEVSEYVSNGGDFHFIISSRHGYNCARKGGILSPALLNKTPILLVHGLKDIFTQNLSALREPLVGFKKVENNPFKGFVELVLDKVPDQHFQDIGEQLRDVEERKQQDEDRKLKKLKTKEESLSMQQLIALIGVEDEINILHEIETFFREKVTDRKVAWAKGNILKKDPDSTPEVIENSLTVMFAKKKEYAEKDLKELFSMQSDPTLIQSTDVANYFSVGIKDISEHISHGGEYHFIICNKHGYHFARTSNILSRMLLSKVPVLLVKGLKDIFTPNLSDVREPLVGFKNVENNPFQELVKSILEKIPDTYLKELFKFSDDRASTVNIMDIEIIPKQRSKRGVLELEDQQAILQYVETFMKNKVTDHRLSWVKANLMKKHADWTPENIDSKLITSFSKRNEYAGKDLKDLLSQLNDTTRIQSCDMHTYFSCGKHSVSEHLQNSGEFHFIICSKNGYGSARKHNIISQAQMSGIRVLLINGLSNIFSYDPSLPHELIVGFKKAESNPFQELVEFIYTKIPSKVVSDTENLEEMKRE